MTGIAQGEPHQQAGKKSNANRGHKARSTAIVFHQRKGQRHQLDRAEQH